MKNEFTEKNYRYNNYYELEWTTTLKIESSQNVRLKLKNYAMDNENIRKMTMVKCIFSRKHKDNKAIGRYYSFRGYLRREL